MLTAGFHGHGWPCAAAVEVGALCGGEGLFGLGRRGHFEFADGDVAGRIILGDDGGVHGGGVGGALLDGAVDEEEA